MIFPFWQQRVGKNFENWYFEVDTQAGDDLTDEEILGLAENTTYWWRLRYRDQELNWSEWSSPVSFSTDNSIALPNLLINSGAEDSLSNWTVVEGVVEALTDGVCDGIKPHSGNRYFAVGGLCEHSAIGRCIQNVDVSSFSDSIDAGNYQVNFGGYLSNFSGSDLPEMKLIFLDENNLELNSSNTLSSLNASWTLFKEQLTIPELTRTIQVELTGTRNAGTDNDSYFDDLFLTLGKEEVDCNVVTALANQPLKIKTLKVIPNPIDSDGYIPLPNTNFTKLKLFLIDANGSKVSCPIKYGKNKISINKGSLTSGTYFFFLRDKSTLIGSGKMVVQ